MPTGSDPPVSAQPPRLARIVVGVDDSPESLHALDLAASIGSPRDAELTIVHVRPHPSSLGFSTVAAFQYEQLQEELDELVHAAAASRLGDYAGAWEVVTRDGHVGHQILEVADEVDADLVVVGHRSHGPVRDAILGSVAAHTVHHSSRSILVAIPPA